MNDPITIDLNAPPVADLSQAIAPLADVPPAPVVTDAASYTAALEYVRDAKRRCDDITRIVAPVKSPAYKAWKAICDLETRAIDRLRAVYEPLERAATNWYSDQQAAAERERQRQLAEARAQEEARLAAEAAALETAGFADEAEAVITHAIERPSPVLVPMAAPVAPKVVGMTMGPVWRFAVETPALVPDEYWVIDESRIRRDVETFKGERKIPGVRIWSEQKPRRTGGRR